MRTSNVKFNQNPFTQQGVLANIGSDGHGTHLKEEELCGQKYKIQKCKSHV
jgi:hypothetical protein